VYLADIPLYFQRTGSFRDSNLSERPATLMRTESSSGKGMITGTIKQESSKTTDMSFDWLEARYEQKPFDPYWDAGKYGTISLTAPLKTEPFSVSDSSDSIIDSNNHIYYSH